VDRVFLDSNVLISAAWLPEPELRQLWGRAAVSLRTSAYALDEARRNLPGADRLARFERLIEALVVVPDDHPEVELPAIAAALPDDDVPILLAAIASRSTHLLTGNKRDFHALYGRHVAGVLVLRPRAYLDLVARR
jgi:predicted nucleic acid-binding protein